MEEDFTGGAIYDQPTRRQWSIDPPFDARVRQLVRDWDASESPELIEEMIVTALKIARDHMSVADLKLINRSIKEMPTRRRSSRRFSISEKWLFLVRLGLRSILRYMKWQRILRGKCGARFYGGHRWRRRNHGSSAAGGRPRA